MVRGLGTRDYGPTAGYLKPETRHLVPISCYPIPGTRYPKPGTRYPVPNTRYLIPATCYPGTWYRYLVNLKRKHLSRFNEAREMVTGGDGAYAGGSASEDVVADF